MANIAYYGSHNAAITVEDKGKILTVIEIERFVGYKNSGVAQYKTCRHSHQWDFENLIKDVLQFVEDKYGIKEYDNCIVMNTDVIIDEKLIKTHEAVPAKRYLSYAHHKAHAAGAFYQSDFKEAIAFSFDGGGDDGKFNIYYCKRGEDPELLERVFNPSISEHRIDYDLGFPYMMFAHYLEDISFEHISEGNLVYPGKIMGLASYGKVREEWLKHFIDCYKSSPNGMDYQDKINSLGSAINVEFDVTKRLSGQLAWDVAATSQKAFEECFLEITKPYIEKYNLPICITGGCALNITLNTRVATEFNRKVFVGPNPNDCGLSVGLMAGFLKPEEPIDVTYEGLPIMDKYMLQYYYNNSSWYKSPLATEDLVNDLSSGKIVGVVRGKSEHGPRALGNRSILCNPAILEMKKILNEKVKHREWYRPFAPVVRLEDVNKYFEWDQESRWMSFCPMVKEEWKEKLPAITHVDGTARVQTVTREQNEWLYDLLTEFEKSTGIGVLLNTSFNVNRMPILTTIKEALQVFENTEMDNLVVENIYIRKKYR